MSQLLEHPITLVEIILSAQFPENLADLPARPSEELLLAILWQDHYVILALPLHVGLALPIFIHDGPPFALRGLPQGGPSIAKNAGTAEPDEFSPAELVD